jgi:hypothetical protein
MNLENLYDILSDCTIQLRKGAEVEERREGMLDVVEIFNMPHEETMPNLEKVDMVFLTIGVDKEEAEKRKPELIEILNSYPDPKRLAGGPSYIEVGAAIGDQGAAFQLFALGKVLGLWEVITPKTLHITNEEQARQLAGVGMIMISGYRHETEKS